MIQATEYAHIILENGCPKIRGSRMKVQHLATAHMHHGWSAHELRWQFSGLSLAQIHSAMAYYYDHQSQLNLQATEEEAWIEELGQKSADSQPSRQILEERAKSQGLQLLSKAAQVAKKSGSSSGGKPAGAKAAGNASRDVNIVSVDAAQEQNRKKSRARKSI